MSWSTVNLQVTTPLFNRGHDLDDDPNTGVRVPALLGAMRFWFRALVGAHVGDNISALHCWEDRVFGRATEGSDSHTSPIQWRIPRQPKLLQPQPQPDWLPSHDKPGHRQGQDRWIAYLLGPGLADLGHCRVNRAFVPPGERFDLQFRVRREDPTAVALALGSLWLMCSFGGVGARTRRGFGGLQITGFDPNGLEVPEPWHHTVKLTDQVGLGYADLQQLWPPRAMKLLKLVVAESGDPPLHQWQAPPPYPVLGARSELSGMEVTSAQLGVEKHLTWDAALAATGEAWRYFRASEDVEGVRYHPQIKTREWLETVWGSDTAFQLGAMGLPVVFKKGIEVNVTQAGETLRRASPIWLRPVPVANRWRMFSFAFLGEFLPTGPGAPTVQLKREHVERTLRVEQQDLNSIVRDWHAVVSGSQG